MPYTVREEAVTARKGVAYNAMGHSFAGMSVQFILFMGIDAGMLVLMQRRTGLWKRLRAAPISKFVIIGSRAASAAMIAMIILFVVFGFARVVFGVRIEGSLPGFVGVCVAFSVMTAAFGMLVAVMGKTPEATRGIALRIVGWIANSLLQAQGRFRAGLYMSMFESAFFVAVVLVSSSKGGIVTVAIAVSAIGIAAKAPRGPSVMPKARAYARGI